MKIICDSVSFVGRKACKWLSCVKEEGNRLPLRIFSIRWSLSLRKPDHRASFCSRIPRSCQKGARVGPSARSISGSLRSSLAVSEQRSSPSRASASFQFAGDCSLEVVRGGAPSFGFFQSSFSLCSKRGSSRSRNPGFRVWRKAINRLPVPYLAHPVGTKSKVSAELVPLVESLRLWLNSETELRC